MSVVKRGKILRGDLANWDGRSATASRVDATGGTLTGLPVGKEVDILQVYGSATNRTKGTIAAAIALIGSANVTLLFSPGTWTIDSSVTIPSNFTCKFPAGAILAPNSGITVTFSGKVLTEDASWRGGVGTITALSVLGPDTTAAERAAGVTPSNYQYPVGHMFRYGVPTDGTSDCTAALNKAIAVAAEVTSGIKFYFPAIGTVYRFTTKPNDIESSMYICGDGRETTLYRDYNGSTAADGLFNFRGEAEFQVVADLSILSVSGRSGGCLISIVADVSNTTGSAGWLRNLRLTTTGTNTHNYAVYIDGSAKIADPVGVRTAGISDVDIFGGSLGALYIKSTMGLRVSGLNTFDAGGTTGKVIVTGTVTVPAYYTFIHGGFVAGLDISTCEQCQIHFADISGNVDIAATAIDPIIIGACHGTVTDSGTYTRKSMSSVLRSRQLRADSIVIGTGITSSSFALEAIGGITGRTSGSVTTVGHAGVAKDTVCPNGMTFTITLQNTLKRLDIATQGGAGVEARADFKSATIDILAPSSEFENSSTPTAGKTGIFKSANSHVISIKNSTGIEITYSIVANCNVSSVTDPA